MTRTYQRVTSSDARNPLSQRHVLAATCHGSLHKKQLQAMARSWETVAAQRAKQLAKPARSKRAPKSK